MINNFYFLVLDYLKSSLNLMIVSMFVLQSRQVEDVQNCEPQTLWLSINARLDNLSLNFPVYWVKIFQNMTQPIIPKQQNLLRLYQTQRSVQKTIPKVIIKKNVNFVCKWCDLIFTWKHNTETWKHKLLFLVFWYFAFLYSLSFIHG